MHKGGILSQKDCVQLRKEGFAACRKAYRLGKWLRNVNKVRKQPVKTQMGLLELLSNGGEAVYYFVEQLTW